MDGVTNNRTHVRRKSGYTIDPEDMLRFPLIAFPDNGLSACSFNRSNLSVKLSEMFLCSIDLHTHTRKACITHGHLLQLALSHTNLMTVQQRSTTTSLASIDLM